ncbi:hypothetical protein HK405_007936 [Cladochytrium tenue]|nr:hypothetical protein HK405_007936 [Cladochytrium tenue]
MSSQPSIPTNTVASTAAGKALAATPPGAQMAQPQPPPPLGIVAAGGASSPPQLLRLLVQQQLLFEGQVELERQFLRIQMLRQMHALQMQRLTAQAQLDPLPASQQDRRPSLQVQPGPHGTGDAGTAPASRRDKSAPPSTDRRGSKAFGRPPVDVLVDSDLRSSKASPAASGPYDSRASTSSNSTTSSAKKPLAPATRKKPSKIISSRSAVDADLDIVQPGTKASPAVSSSAATGKLATTVMPTIPIPPIPAVASSAINGSTSKKPLQLSRSVSSSSKAYSPKSPSAVVDQAAGSLGSPGDGNATMATSTGVTDTPAADVASTTSGATTGGLKRANTVGSMIRASRNTPAAAAEKKKNKPPAPGQLSADDIMLYRRSTGPPPKKSAATAAVTPRGGPSTSDRLRCLLARVFYFYRPLDGKFVALHCHAVKQAAPC